MYYDPIYANESIYIAGPECFYTYGYPHWYALAGRAKMFGCDVSLPNDKELKLGAEDKREDAHAIFDNCAESMNRTTAIIADLEFYRGPDVDGGSLFEVGMAYARDCRCYGYTRDLREMRFKYQGAKLTGDAVYDQKGRPLPYADLPFSPNVLGACKIVEGDFDDAMKQMLLDITEERKQGKYPRVQRPMDVQMPKRDKPLVLLAGPERWDKDAAAKYEQMKKACAARGLEAICPLDDVQDAADAASKDRYARAYAAFQRNVKHVQDCDIVIANLNDFHGWEPESDTSFECGMAWQLGKKLYGYMDNNCKMIDRVPHFGEAREYRDHCGCNVENFDYPINLMFAASMPVYGGAFEDVLDQIVADLDKE